MTEEKRTDPIDPEATQIEFMDLDKLLKLKSGLYQLPDGGYVNRDERGLFIGMRNWKRNNKAIQQISTESLDITSKS